MNSVIFLKPTINLVQEWIIEKNTISQMLKYWNAYLIC